MKAFLSHNSADKKLVGAVADILTRWYCTYDAYSFETGTSFIESIRKHLSNCDIFVLFASKSSLVRPYVEFEISEAEYLLIFKNIKKSLVFIIDDLKYDELPPWMSKFKIVSGNDARYISREIFNVINDLITKQKGELYWGRDADMAKIEDIIYAPNTDKPSRFLFISGLYHIGRRTFAKNVARSKLNYSNSIIVDINDGDSEIEIAAKLYEIVYNVVNINEIKSYINKCKLLPFHSVIEDILNHISFFEQRRELVIFFDKGGMLDQNGYVNDFIFKLLNQINETPKIYALFISSRRPHANDLSIPHLRLGHLSIGSIMGLLSELAVSKEVQISHQQIEEIANYVGGYPPSAMDAITSAKIYGPEAVLLDKKSLIDFRINSILKHFATNILTDLQIEILKLFAVYNTLSLSIIGRCLECSAEDITTPVMGLIDVALVEFNGEMYEIALPVIDTVVRLYGKLNPTIHKKMHKILSAYMKESEHEVPAILKFARMLYRSCIYLDLKPDELSIKFASDVMDLAEEYYNNKEYDRAIAMAKESLQIKDGFYKAHSILVRSYIQKEMWTEFENAFIGFRSVAQPKDIHYFLGFKARKEGNIDTAIREYATAIDFRYTGFPIYRELAQCHLARGDYFEAEKNVKIAISKKPENKYVVDMHAKIAALLGKSKDAFDALEVLQIVDSQENYFHRKSTVMLLLGDVDGALESALKAISFSNDTPRFEVIAQALHCYIRKNDFTQADYYYNKLKSLYPKKKLDVQNALRCKMSLITHNTAEAIEYYSRIINKSTKHASQLLYEIANNSLTDPNLGVEDKEKYSKIIESFSLDKKIDFISSEF